MDYKSTNREAILTAEKTYGKLRDAEDFNNPSEIIHYLRTILGLKCSECGSSQISWNTLKYFDFEPTVKCYTCQNN